MPRSNHPLVGRLAELAVLTAALDDAARQDAAAVLLSGDAGVGKTRLLTEVAARAAERGTAVLIGHCIDFGDAALPYLPLSEAFGRLATEQPERVERLVADYPPIARLLPARRRLDAPVSPPDERIERSALFEAVLGAFGELAADRPLYVVVEDVHWADQSTRDLLGFLLARIRDEQLTIAVSYRSDDLHRRHPLRRSVAEWSRLPKVQRVHVAPLDDVQLRELIRELHPGALSAHDVRQIVTRSEGNAFFAEELLAATETQLDAGTVPSELADLLLVRLDRLGERARDIVRVAAVAGRHVPHALLAMVSDLPETVLDEALREAVDAQILVAHGESGYGFRHALLAEAVYDDLLPGERVRLHATYAAQLPKQSAVGTAAELARHARESHDLATAFAASIRAGDEAMTVAAPDEAMRHYETALELLPSAPDGDISGPCLVRAAADAASAAGHRDRAVALIRQAVADLPADAEPDIRAGLLQALAVHQLNIDADLDALSATEQALALVPAEPVTSLRARVIVVHARVLNSMGRDTEAARWAQLALDAARQLEAPDIAADAETTLAVLQRRSGNATEAAQRLRSVADDARGAGEVPVELRSRYLLGMLHYEQGDLDAALRAFRSTAQRARQSGRQWAAYGVDARMMAGLTEYVMGDWDASLRTLDVEDEDPPSVAEAGLSAVRLAVRTGRGELAALDQLPALRAWWSRDGMFAVLSTGPAIDLYGTLGRVEDAQALLDEAVTLITELWQSEHFMARVRMSALMLGALAQAVDDQPTTTREEWAERGRALIEAARASAEHGMPAGRQLGVEGNAWRMRAEAEWARLRWRAGVDPPAAAELIEIWERTVDGFGYGHVYEQARSRVRLAAVLRVIGTPQAAREQADLARPVARRLGAQPLLDELRALGTSPAPGATTDPMPLTPRERDVLALLVEGRTNRQIARRLYISEKTVSVHVSNILAKLGVASRTEAAAVARRDALLS
ncbi:MAG: AAA family ATPase [Actinomycetota bacterium]